MVRTNTINLPGFGAGVVRIKGTDRALAMSVDGNGRYCYLDPRRGAMLAVAEAARNVACTGARPLAATNCLNFGNPGAAGDHVAVRPGRRRHRRGVPRARTCRSPAATSACTTRPTAMRSIPRPSSAWSACSSMPIGSSAAVSRQSGDVVVLLGEGRGELGGSEYLKLVYDQVRGVPPALDLDRERALQALLVALAESRLVRSADDCSDGGIAVTLAECCFDGRGDRSGDLD